MAFYICKKCKAGCSALVDEATRKILGFSIDGAHRPGDCDGEVEVVSDAQAGAGPGMLLPKSEKN